MLNFHDEINEAKERISSPEQMLGKGLLEPNNNLNSGSRKIMFGIQLEHALNLMYPEVAYLSTGYEIRFGDRSSSLIKAKSDFEVMDKIYKFETVKDQHYWLITRNLNTNELDVIERIPYNHLTESYGYMYNNTILDNLDLGYEVPKDEILRKSTAFDEYGNRCDGTNLLTAYIASNKSMEDGIIISESAAKKLTAPLIKKVTIVVNDNDIPLNLYGDDSMYKSFPDINEEIKDGILCGIRRENMEDCLFAQSKERLKNILMSDEKFTVEGSVIDIDIYSNNPESIMTKHHNSQINYYLQNKIRYMSEFVDGINKLKSKGYNKMSYKLQKTYSTFVAELNKTPYIKDKVYSGTIIEIHVLEESVPMVGDKITNRYGGKGVISKIFPDDEMPYIETWYGPKPIDMMMNSSTCVNRLNPGQLMEVSLSHIGMEIVEFIRTGVMDTDEAINLICKFISFTSEDQAKYIYNALYKASPEDREGFVRDVEEKGCIYLSNKPISESVSLDLLNEIYKAFPFVKQKDVFVPMVGSDGTKRFIKAYRTIVPGYEYVYRLKQYAEEKFSVTSMSSTNITGENTKNKANKNFRSIHASTPVRFGDMETGDFAHLGMDWVVSTLMIHSVSPQARRLVEHILTKDPYNVDIKLDEKSRNRNAEKLNAYLKTMGLKLVFIKKKKEYKPAILYQAVTYENKPLIQPIQYVSEEERGFNIIEYSNKLAQAEEEFAKRPVYYEAISYEE